MGNCCGERANLNDLSYIKTLDVYLKCVLDNLSRIQEQIASHSQMVKNNNQRKIRDSTNQKNGFEHCISYEREQFDILFGNALLKLKIIIEDYYNYTNYLKETNDNNNAKNPVPQRKNDYEIDYSTKEFNFNTAVPFLQKLLDTEEIADKKILEELNNSMIDSVFTNK